MATGRHLALWLLLALAVASTKPQAAETSPSLLARCWSPAELALKAGERPPIRRAVPIDLAALTAAPLADAVPVTPGLRGSIRRVDLPPGRKLVALTFDLCETSGEVAGYDGAIVDYLRANTIHATFFASGHWIATHPDRAAQLIADPLFEIGSHGWVHLDARHLSPDGVAREFDLTQAAYAQARASLAARSCTADATAELEKLAPRLALHRFPYGTCNKTALDTAAQSGQLAIQWDVVSGDPDPSRSAGSISSGIAANIRPGSIVVAHANGRGWNTASALPRLIPRLRAEGYEFATVSELLAAGTPVIAATCYEHRPGDQRTVMSLSRPGGPAAPLRPESKHGFPAILGLPH